MPAASLHTAPGTALERIWKTLGVVRRVLFTAESGPASRMRWHGEGAGSVCVSTQACDAWLVERGSFLPTGSGRRVAFNASWHWELSGERLRLSRERYGTDAPVFLCDFVTQDAMHLVCERPHLCSADSYRCTLTLTEQGFDADWSIAGPRKDESLKYHYFR